MITPFFYPSTSFGCVLFDCLFIGQWFYMKIFNEEPKKKSVFLLEWFTHFLKNNCFRTVLPSTSKQLTIDNVRQIFRIVVKFGTLLLGLFYIWAIRFRIIFHRLVLAPYISNLISPLPHTHTHTFSARLFRISAY